MHLTSDKLPPSIAAFVEAGFGRAGIDSIGPVQLEYGVWSFVILGRKPGRGLLPYAAVRPRLRAHLMALADEEDIRKSQERMKSKIESAHLEGIRAALLQEAEEGHPALPRAMGRT
ncbi:MAG TPA: hypothetical protein VJ385_06490 [Fibrobacteria bacterium]|nr:hypothetical protein [Fibrobacteria bacterium]